MTAATMRQLCALLPSVCLSLGCTRTPSTPATVRDVPAEHRRTHAYYRERCSQCHGDQGEGNAYGPSLAAWAAQPADARDARLVEVTTKGLRPRGGVPWLAPGMPITGALSPGARDSLVRYVGWALPDSATP